MTDWLSGIDRDDIRRVDLVGVTLGGIRAGVERAWFDIHLRDGRIVSNDQDFDGMAYETLVDLVESFNRSRRANGPGRAGDRRT